MKNLTLNSKSGFLSNDKEIKIFDENGKEFYFFSPKTFPFHFNLPKGKYFTENKLFSVKPKSYDIRLPKPEKKGFDTKGFKIKFVDGLGLGWTDIKSKIIGLHKIFLSEKVYKPCLFFVYAHELGHNYFFDETKCDLFAKNLMLQWGFNKSQIIKAKNLTLKNKKRVCENLETLKNL